jgi:hypothetical protein
MPQCTSCPYSSADECLSCSSAGDYHNPVTYQCTGNCSAPYFPTRNGSKQCLPCLLPCKTCLGYYDQCGSCYFGHYLLNGQCSSSCPSNSYEDSLNNLCLPCASNCATCNSNECLTCQSSNYFYAGSCYASCPPAAPYPFGLYCRNCLADQCILCNSNGACTYCSAPYLLSPQGTCLAACAEDYEPDSLTATRCVKQPAAAFAEYVAYLEAMKVWTLPGCLALVLSLLLLPFAELRMMGLLFLLAVPQSLALVQFVVLYFSEQGKLIPDVLSLPPYLGWLMLALHLLLCPLHTVLLWLNMLRDRKSYQKWLSSSSNGYRMRILMTFACLNKQAIYLAFSGMFGLPMASLHFYDPPRSFYATHSAYLLFETAIVFVAALIVIAKQTMQYNLKLFFASLDLLIIFAVSLILDLIFAYQASRQSAPAPYQKYLIPKVSNYSLPALSDPP